MQYAPGDVNNFKMRKNRYFKLYYLVLKVTGKFFNQFSVNSWWCQKIINFTNIIKIETGVRTFNVWSGPQIIVEMPFLWRHLKSVLIFIFFAGWNLKFFCYWNSNLEGITLRTTFSNWLWLEKDAAPHRRFEKHRFNTHCC